MESVEVRRMMDTDSWLVSLLAKIVNRIGLNTLASLLLLLVCLGALALTLGSLLRELSPDFFLRVACMGVLAGWLLARSRLPTIWAFLVMTTLGFGWAALFLGRLWASLFEVLFQIKNLGIESWWWQTLEDYGPPLLDPLVHALLEFSGAHHNLIQRCWMWAVGFVNGQQVFDPLVTAIVWSLGIWFISSWAGWAVRRLGQPIAALLPAGVMLASVLNYSGASTYSLLAFLGALFLLVLHVLQQKRERTWESQKIDFPSDMRMDLALPTLPLVVFILVLAAVVPSISIRKIVDLTRNLTSQTSSRYEQAGEALGLERLPAPRSSQNWTQGGLPRSHLLQAEIELSQRQALIIKTGDFPPGPIEVMANRRPPIYYWRSQTFEYYTGRGWINSNPETSVYQAGELARFLEAGTAPGAWENPKGYQLVEHEISTLSNTAGILYTPGFFITADHPYEVAWRLPNTFSTGEPGGGDVVGGRVEGQSYHIKSLSANPSLTQLRSAGSSYPEWINTRYLSLPDTLPPRLYSLALDLTANATAPYDRARAIEQYLRNIPYDLDISLPPADRDVVDYYIYDLKRGYCDYSATAMVVLARAAGLPARLVMGYAGGSYNSNKAHYEIREENAHSWPEIYFADTGWVEFEPTSSLPEIVRSQEFLGPQNYQTAQTLSFASLPSQNPSPLLWFAISLGLLLGLTVWGWEFVDQKRLQRLPAQETIQVIYLRFSKRANKLRNSTE
jgi:transglutaminase-like putative cysteine protease